ncbi:MAG: heavy metal translocating P-type ATPase [Thermoplasmata archaeon]|nr:heavy metal translocating P-type ATPase [Thermoplasmata archaeon]
MQGTLENERETPTYEAAPIRIGPILRRYPLPFVAVVGLAVGGSLTYLFQLPGLGRWVWLGTLIVGGVPLVFQTAQRLIRGEFASDVIAMLAILGALALDQAFAGVIIVLMQSSGEAIDSYAFHRASASLRELLKRAPRRARRRRDDAVDEISVEEVAVGDRLVVLAGDMLPVDGTVASPEALIDEAAVTGEPLPKRRFEGERVLSGTISVGAPFDMRADRRSQESTYSRIVELVRSAQERKPPLQRLADRFAVWFTPLALAVAVIGWVLTHAPQTALAVLVVATPCPLIIATPIAVIGAVNRAADRGLVVKSGGAIEEIGRARVVVFDKTGTLTAGRPEVQGVVTFDPTWSDADLLRRAGALEQLSSHPLAAATVREARKIASTLPTPRDVVETGGAGIEGTVDGRRLLVGSASLVRRRTGQELVPEWQLLHARHGERGWLVAFVLVDGKAAGAILYADALRPGVPAMVDRLRTLGVEHVVLLTGDSVANATEIAGQAHITEFTGELLPEGKVERIRGYRDRVGSTVMVGDGINDAAALASASVGVAMGARGAGISVEAADIVLLVDDITRIPEGIALGQRMVLVARQGIYFGLGASLVLMGIAAGGSVLPALGAILQEIIDVLVILNALRVR